MEKLNIIIPAYNEAQTIGEIIKRVHSSSTPGFEKNIIVVNDGSKDNTLTILKELQPRYKLTIINCSENKGKGKALKEAFKKVDEGVILIQDADLEYDPANYKSLLETYHHEKQPVIYGRRNRSRGYRPYIWGNTILNFFFNLLFGTSFSDIYTGHKVFRCDILKNHNLESNGFGFEGEITAKVIKSGYPIKEVPIHYNPRSFKEGKKIRVKDGFVGIDVILKNYLNKVFYTFLKYTLGGALSYLLRIGITALLTESIGVYYLHSYIITLIIVSIVGFYYSAYITFEKTNRQIWRGAKFIITTLLFYLFDAFFVWMLTSIFEIHYALSITAVAFLLFILKFFWFKKLVFN